MGLFSMTVYRIRKIIAWIMAIAVVVLLGAGLFWVISVV